MHYFEYKKNELYCEEVRIKDIVNKVGTPVYIYSLRTALEHFLKLQKAFENMDHLICYSVKANSNLALCHALAKKGCGADIVSGGELYRALKAGFPNQKIVFAGVGKTEEEIEYAIKTNIFMFNVESFPEAELINKVAKRLRKTGRISIRVNPDVNPYTHAYITTGKKENKFGISFREAPDFYRKLKKLSNVEVIGIHLHIGSQIMTPDPYRNSIRRGISLIQKLKKMNIHLSVINIGGGMGIIYKDEHPMTAQQFADAVLPLIKNLDCKAVLEPGRHIVGNAGILVAKITYVKKTPVKKFFIVDAGMNDLIRPPLYDAYHKIQPVLMNGRRKTAEVDVVGPVCESADFFAKGRILPEMKSGDLLAIMSAGAYGFVMSSNYNTRPRAAEVLVNKNKFRITRKRENIQDLIRGESI